MTGFTHLSVDLDIQDGSWGEYLQEGFKHGVIDRVGNLPEGTAGGKPAFQLLATLDDGTKVIVETTWVAMDAATSALRARWTTDAADSIDGMSAQEFATSFFNRRVATCGVHCQGCEVCTPVHKRHARPPVVDG